jgi:hypothetical protein
MGKDYLRSVERCTELMDKFMFAEQERVKIASLIGESLASILADQTDPDILLQRFARDISLVRRKYTDISILRKAYQLHLFLQSQPDVPEFVELTMDNFITSRRRPQLSGQTMMSKTRQILNQVLKGLDKSMRTIYDDSFSAEELNNVQSVVEHIEQRLEAFRSHLADVGLQPSLLTTRAEESNK